MRFFYVFAIRFYGFFIKIVSPFNHKAKDWVTGRKQLWDSLPDVADREVYWFHCASLGEFDQGLPVMNLLRNQKPNVFILVTFFSPSGYNHYKKRKNPVDFACYIPLDTKKNAKRFVEYFKPKKSFFIKYEFWTNHIFQLKKNDSKLYSVSTSLRASQHYFKWYGSFFRKTLNQFDYFFAQNQSTVDLLHSINIENVSLTGDTRFDRVLENKNALVKNDLIEYFVADNYNVFIAGSTWPKDEELLIDLIHSDLFEKYIIVPHNVDKEHIEKLQNQINKKTSCYSKLDKNSRIDDVNVLIVDTIGQLASAYSFGTIAYVGGGFSGNLHNILEPAVFGLPVIYGPKFSRFPEGNAFIEEEIGFSVTEKNELLKTIQFTLQNKKQISDKSIAFVEKNKGASQKVLKFVESE